MDSYERKEAFAQARAESLDALERIADIEVERRDYSEPDALEQWRSGMPPQPKPPTMAEVESLVDSRINSALAGQPRALTPKAAAEVIHEVRTALRKEFADEIAKLRSEYAPPSAGSQVIDLPPALPMRSSRRAT